MSPQGPSRGLAVALVGTGGFLGSVLRHAVTVGFPTTALGTLAVNVLGSFALGILLSDSRIGARVSPRLRLLFGTGLLSSFTTYSTFALSTTTLPPLWAVVYVAANYGLAIVAVAVAHALARWVS